MVKSIYMSDITNLTKKHDQIAKKFLTDISVAKEFLTIHLAPELLAKCDINSLQIESGSYVEEDLATHFSDVVYRLNLKENKGILYSFCLIEHQSSAEELMPLRILRYQIAIIQKYLAENKKAKQLPIVSALVIYNGNKSPYPYTLDIASLFADVEAYNKAPLGSFKLVDLTVIDDNELLQHKKLALLEILIKHINDREFIKAIDTIVKALKIGFDSGIDDSLLHSAFSYLLNAKETDELKQLVKKIDESIPQIKENIMTYAEELRCEGRQEGMQIGEQRGMQIGEQKAQTQIAKDLLKSGIDRAIVAKATHLTLEQLNKLS